MHKNDNDDDDDEDDDDNSNSIWVNSKPIVFIVVQMHNLVKCQLS